MRCFSFGKLSVWLSIFIFYFSNNYFNSCAAAQGNKDFESWSAITIKYKLNSKWSFFGEEQLRFDRNSTRFDQFFTELSAEKRIDEQWEYDFGFRLKTSYDYMGANTGFESSIRAYFSLSNTVFLGALTVKNSIAYQLENTINQSKLEGDYTEKYLRLRSKFFYNIRGLKEDPYVFFEAFRRWHIGTLNGYVKYRFGAGYSFNLPNKQSLRLFYFRERETRFWNAELNNVIGFNYRFSFKK